MGPWGGSPSRFQKKKKECTKKKEAKKGKKEALAGTVFVLGRSRPDLLRVALVADAKPAHNISWAMQCREWVQLQNASDDEETSQAAPPVEQPTLSYTAKLFMRVAKSYSLAAKATTNT